MTKVFIRENSVFYKKGEIKKGLLTSKGLLIGEDLLPNKQFIVLSEALTPQDKKEIEQITRELLEKMFWRMYTRSGFLLK